MNNNSVPLDKIQADKIIWIGGYPAHYVRQMHLAVEAARASSIHFIYIVDKYSTHQCHYEQGNLPNCSSLLDSHYSIWRFLQRLENITPKAIIAAGYNRRLIISALIWSFWKDVNYCLWGDTNLVTVQAQNIVYCDRVPYTG